MIDVSNQYRTISDLLARLAQEFGVLADLTYQYSTNATVAADEAARRSYDKLCARLVDDLELSVRSSNCLRRENIQTVGELITYSETDLLHIPHFGRRSLREVKEVVHNLGLKLAEP